MKKISHVSNGERIEHTGDLTIEGHVGEGAVIEIKDGSLFVEGNVGAKSQIHINAPALRNKSVVSGLGSIVTSSGGRVVSYVGASMRFGGSGVRISQIGGNVHGTVKLIRADHCMSMNGIDIYTGNVNIHNRILTNGQVKDCGADTYEISANSGDVFSFLIPSSQASSDPVSATIDGVIYTGILIRIEGTNVIVDGRRQENAAAAATGVDEAAQDTQLNPPRLCIKGSIHDEVRINSDVAMDLQEIGRNCALEGIHEGITAGNVGDGTEVNVRGAIQVKNIGVGVKLNSSQYGIKAKNIGNRSTIAVRDAIEVENIGDFCTVTSKVYGISAENIGIQTTINVRDAVSLKNIGSDSKITSKMYGINAKNLSNRIQIQVRDSIRLQSVGEACDISSQQARIEVEGHVSTSSQLKAREDIIVNSLGDYTKLHSTHGRIKTLGITGNNVIFSARESVHLKDVGSNVQITSTHNEVSLRNIGVNATINAREGIDIDGTCPEPHTLSLTAGRGQRIQRPTKTPRVPQAGITPQASVTMAQSESTNTTDIDPRLLQRAWQLVEEINQMESEIKLGQVGANAPAATQAFKEPQAAASASAVQAKDTYLTGSYEGDLLRAMELSQESAKVSSVGMFSPAATTAIKAAITIPDSFQCPISLQIMREPVICTLDERTYERSEITAWLITHRTSPFTRLAMKEDQTVETVLLKNRALATSIEEFLQQHPELDTEPHQFNMA